MFKNLRKLFEKRQPKPRVKLCRDCKYAVPEPGSSWSLRCTNPEVNRRDPYMLSGAPIYGSSARTEREKELFSPCGMKGKLWESIKNEDQV